MEELKLYVTYGGISIPIGWAVWAAIKSVVAKLLEQHKRLMMANNKFLEDRISILENQLIKNEQLVKDSTVKMNELNLTIATMGVELGLLDRTIEKHDHTLHEILPAIRTEIGKLSMYYKK